MPIATRQECLHPLHVTEIWVFVGPIASESGMEPSLLPLLRTFTESDEAAQAWKEVLERENVHNAQDLVMALLDMERLEGMMSRIRHTQGGAVLASHLQEWQSQQTSRLFTLNGATPGEKRFSWTLLAFSRLWRLCAMIAYVLETLSNSADVLLSAFVTIFVTVRASEFCSGANVLIPLVIFVLLSGVPLQFGHALRFRILNPDAKFPEGLVVVVACDKRTFWSTRMISFSLEAIQLSLSAWALSIENAGCPTCVQSAPSAPGCSSVDFTFVVLAVSITEAALRIVVVALFVILMVFSDDGVYYMFNAYRPSEELNMCVAHSVMELPASRHVWRKVYEFAPYSSYCPPEIALVQSRDPDKRINLREFTLPGCLNGNVLRRRHNLVTKKGAPSGKLIPLLFRRQILRLQEAGGTNAELQGTIDRYLNNAPLRTAVREVFSDPDAYNADEDDNSELQRASRI